MDVSFKNLCKIFVEQAEVGFGWADQDGDVKYLNPALTNMLALKNPEEVYNKPVFQFYNSETISKLENRILSAVMMEGYWTGELLLVPKKGKGIMTLNYLFAIKNDFGKLFFMAILLFQNDLIKTV